MTTDAWRKLTDGAMDLTAGATIDMTGDECAAVIDRIVELEDTLRRLADTSRTRMVMSYVRPEHPAEGNLWREKVQAHVSAVADAEEALGRGRRGE